MSSSPRPEIDPEHFAAIDLGSNSFHMIRARRVFGELQVVDRLRERVRLAGGLDAAGNLSAEAQERGLSCLRRFAESLAQIKGDNIRIVGTNTLRKAENAREFVEAAEEILDHSVEIISGQEEARLIYRGVCGIGPPSEGPRLVIDIGGGSTEIILGQGIGVDALASVPMGCVSYSRDYFGQQGQDPLSAISFDRDRFDAAVLAARVELEPVVASMSYRPNMETLGTSGTIHALSKWGRSLDEDHAHADRITYTMLKRMRKILVNAKNVDSHELDELKADRRPVIAGGLSVLMAVFRSFGIESLRPAPAGLREGLLFDLIGRHQHDDARERTIRTMGHRFHLDRVQGSRVEEVARRLLEAAAEPFGLQERKVRLALSWASRLHEVGLAISHSGYHKHGEYLVQYSDMPGFSQDDQELVALLIRWHRRRFPEPRQMNSVSLSQKQAHKLCLILRLAVLLNRSRSQNRHFEPEVDASHQRLALKFPPGWLFAHPLTAAELDNEASGWKNAGFELVVE